MLINNILFHEGLKRKYKKLGLLSKPVFTMNQDMRLKKSCNPLSTMHPHLFAMQMGLVLALFDSSLNFLCRFLVRVTSGCTEEKARLLLIRYCIVVRSTVVQINRILFQGFLKEIKNLRLRQGSGGIVKDHP